MVSTTSTRPPTPASVPTQLSNSARLIAQARKPAPDAAYPLMLSMVHFSFSSFKEPRRDGFAARIMRASTRFRSSGV